jgi:hypothetical protein
MFSSKKYSGPDGWRPMAPDGYIAIEGDIDHLSKRMDVQAGVVVEYQPPQPDANHEWDDKTDPARPRWRRKPEVVAKELRTNELLSLIAAAEARGHRRVREILARSDLQLKALDDEIALLRSQLTDGS